MRNYEKILANQKVELERLMSEPDIIDRAPSASIDLNSPVAQIVTGIRRCGKSVLCRLALKRAGRAFGYVDFDDEALDGIEASDLDDVFKAALVVYGPFDMLYLDEIQDVPAWELFVNRLLRRRIHLVITGSNSKLLFSDLATHLTGRFVSIELNPFSFSEYRRWLGRGESGGTEWMAELRRDYVEYFHCGGFPETFRIADRRGYFKALYDSILVRDILHRHKVRNPKLLADVAFVAMSNHAQEISALKLANQLSAASVTTIQNYLTFLAESRLVDLLPRYGRKAWEKTRVGKVYAADNGLVSYFTGVSDTEEGHGRRLENLVWTALRAKRFEYDCSVSYLKEPAYEVDFIMERFRRPIRLVQVAYDISNPKTRERELSALFAASRHLGCDDLLLVTDHESGEETRDGMRVRIVDAPTWLLEFDRESISETGFADAFSKDKTHLR